MSRFKVSAKSGCHPPSQPMTPAEFAAGAAMVKSQVGSRPAKPIRLNLDLDPDLHRRLKVRAAEAGISIAELVRGLITREIG
ncbi:ribbon-helix-helix protein [Burkholderia pseudomallei]|uniref:ribbon-helix-helix protein n=1 Tax=Burkholderia pseudomallei TaxID=28450 RepID=UPI000CDE2510|nr:toxin-antitoxin system HicB family antitoxin [Burkholderia pseudomallei]